MGIDLVALYQDKLRYAAEIVPLTELFFLADVTDEEEAKTVLAEEQVPVVLRAFARSSQLRITQLDVDSIKAAIKSVQRRQVSKASSCSCRFVRRLLGRRMVLT